MAFVTSVQIAEEVKIPDVYGQYSSAGVRIMVSVSLSSTDDAPKVVRQYASNVHAIVAAHCRARFGYDIDIKPE